MAEVQDDDSAHLVRQLTSLDAQFLAIEDSRNFSHISGLAILDPSTAPGGSLDLGDVQRHIEERLHLLPPFRWRLAEVPFGIDHPWWVDDPDFDIEFHVRELALPAPGDDAQLAVQVERLVSRPLDRSKPLWEIYLVQGLERGRVALVPKIHHAVVDGVSGAEIMGTLFDLEPTGRDVSAPPKKMGSERVPTSLELFGKGVIAAPWRVAEAAVKLPSTLPYLVEIPTIRGLPGVDLVTRAADRARRAVPAGRDGAVLNRSKAKAPRTILNGPVSAHRRVSFGSLSLPAVKLIKDAFKVKVNDVVVALSAGACLLYTSDAADE